MYIKVFDRCILFSINENVFYAAETSQPITDVVGLQAAMTDE